MGDDILDELLGRGVSLLKKINGSSCLITGGTVKSTDSIAPLPSLAIHCSDSISKGISKPVRGRQSKNSGVSCSTSKMSPGKLMDGMSNGMHVSPATGAKCVKSSGSSLRTLKEKTTNKQTR